MYNYFKIKILGLTICQLAQLVDSSQLNQKVAPFQLPPGIDIMLGDVSGGSSSVSMVFFLSEGNDKGNNFLDY